MANQFCADTGHRGWRKISLSCDVANVRKTGVALIGQSVRNFMRPNNPIRSSYGLWICAIILELEALSTIGAAVT